MTRCILITGINGWTGYHLTLQVLRDENTQVLGLGLSPELRSSLRVFADRITYYKCDLAGSADALVSVLEKQKVDGIIHLAGLTVSNDWSALLQTNVLGTVNLLKTILSLREAWNINPPVLIVSSSAAYGISVSEDSPL